MIEEHFDVSIRKRLQLNKYRTYAKEKYLYWYDRLLKEWVGTSSLCAVKCFTSRSKDELLDYIFDLIEADGLSSINKLNSFIPKLTTIREEMHDIIFNCDPSLNFSQESRGYKALLGICDSIEILEKLGKE